MRRAQWVTRCGRCNSPIEVGWRIRFHDGMMLHPRCYDALTHRDGGGRQRVRRTTRVPSTSRHSGLLAGITPALCPRCGQLVAQHGPEDLFTCGLLDTNEIVALTDTRTIWPCAVCGEAIPVGIEHDRAGGFTMHRRCDPWRQLTRSS